MAGRFAPAGRLIFDLLNEMQRQDAKGAQKRKKIFAPLGVLASLR
jgi:hypothetical protein